VADERIEIVRRALDALTRGDVDAAFVKAAPDAEFDQSRAVGMDRGVYSLEEFRRLTREFINSWDSVTWEADELISGEQHVVTPFTNRLRGRDGIEVEARGFLVWAFREGVVTRVTLYQERAEALDAAGLAD
jgi:ketosteroid isomerase-like protein